MLYSETVNKFYWNCHKEVKRLLHRYSKRFISSRYEADELEQRFYFMIIHREVIERFDNSVTNPDKVFTSYICEVIKNFCREERRYLKKERSKLNVCVSELEDPRGGRVCIFDAAQYTWLPGNRSGGTRYNASGVYHAMPEEAGRSFEELVDKLCGAISADSDLSDEEKRTLLSLVANGSAGMSAGNLATSLKCPPARVSELRKQARSKFAEYRSAGHV